MKKILISIIGSFLQTQKVSGVGPFPLRQAIKTTTLRLTQKFQEIRGTAQVKGRETPIADARLVGDQLSFALWEDTDKERIVMQFKGQINGNVIAGNVEVQGGPLAGNQTWAAKR